MRGVICDLTMKFLCTLMYYFVNQEAVKCVSWCLCLQTFAMFRLDRLKFVYNSGAPKIHHMML